MQRKGNDESSVQRTRYELLGLREAILEQKTRERTVAQFSNQLK